MDPVRVGADIRLLRRERGWTQARLAEAAEVSRGLVMRLEAGRCAAADLGDVARVVSVLGGYLSVRVLYRGEGLDRLRDRRHAALVERLIRVFRAAGWIVEPEVSFSIYGERGSIDILGFHPGTGALLIIEVKTVVPDLGGMLATLDRKVRLAREIVRERGWKVRHVSRLLVLPEDRTARRRVSEHTRTFEAALPSRNVDVRRWIQAPSGPMAGLLFLPNVAQRKPRARNGT